MSNEQSLELQVEKRTPVKNSSRKLKHLGEVPIVVYGSKNQNFSLSLKTNVAKKYASSQFDNKIFVLNNKDKDINGLKVIKKSVDFHRVTRDPMHMDFFALDMTKKVKVTVEIHFEGKARGVKESGGVFQILKRSVEVECLPHEIPNFFSIDVSDLEMSASYHVSDVKIPSNVKLITRGEEALCSVIESQEEIVATPAADATAEATADGEAGDKPAEGAEATAPAKEEEKKSEKKKE